MNKVVCSWSGGKDSAMALSEIMRSRVYEVQGLITTICEDYNRVSMQPEIRFLGRMGITI